MKNPILLLTRVKTSVVLMSIFAFVKPALSQTDTLHLYYNQVSTKLSDTADAKLSKWIKGLNGQHVNINVCAYYSKSEYKKYATERTDELFLLLNRKARSLFTIDFIGPKKGENYQRTTVDIIYRRPGTNAPTETKAAPVTKTEEPKKTEAKPAAEKKAPTGSAEKPAKEHTEAPKETAKAAEKPATKPAPAAKPGSGKAFVASDEFKSRKLIVVLLDENEYEVNRISDAAELAAYKNNVKTHNENITEAFKSAWKETEVDFITESDLEKTSLDQQALGWTLLLPGKAKIDDVPFMTYNVSMIYPKGKKNTVYEKEFKISVSNEMPAQGDFLLLMYKMKVFFNLQKEADKAELAKTLAAKTLYVDKDMAEISQDEFKAEYIFPFAFTSAQDIAAKTAGRDKNALYLKTDVYGSSINLMVVDAESGAVIARSPVSGLNKVTPVVSTGKYGFAAQNKLNTAGTEIQYRPCYECPFSASEVFKTFNTKTHLKKGMLKNLGDEKYQMKNNPMIAY